MKTRSEHEVEELGPPSSPFLTGDPSSVRHSEEVSGGLPSMLGQHFDKTFLIYRDCISFLLSGRVLSSFV